MKYRKLPVVVDAIPVRMLTGEWDKLPTWARAAFDDGTLIVKPGGVGVMTLEGWMSGGLEDWLIRGVKGELYCCRADIFAQSYEPADVEVAR